MRTTPDVIILTLLLLPPVKDGDKIPGDQSSSSSDVAKSSHFTCTLQSVKLKDPIYSWPLGSMFIWLWTYIVECNWSYSYLTSSCQISSCDNSSSDCWRSSDSRFSSNSSSRPIITFEATSQSTKGIYYSFKGLCCLTIFPLLASLSYLSKWSVGILERGTPARDLS